MDDLTQRQIDILKTIIQEYTETGEPVGSGILEKKYKLGISPATIRNEMVELAKKGYLKKTYFSSGRMPSARGFRFYISHLMKEKELSTTDEVAFKNSIWDDKNERHRLLSQAARVLAQRTGLLSIVATNLNDFYYSGVANILTQNEFYDLDLTRSFFERLEKIAFWGRLLEQFDKNAEEVMYLLGEEDFQDPLFDPCGSIFAEFNGQNIKGVIGVLGSRRMYYESIVPQIRYFSGLIENLLKEQTL